MSDDDVKMFKVEFEIEYHEDWNEKDVLNDIEASMKNNVKNIKIEEIK